MPAPPSPSLIQTGGHVTSTIRLVRCLGEGGMGSVWIADHLALRTQVVVKFMAAELGASAEAVERFSREAAAAAQVKSPHVVQMLDHGITPEGVPFIVMEMLEGHDLGKHLEDHGRLTLTETAEIVAQVSKALARAHERGIVHRDIKPENIFLCDVGGSELFVKLLDFGIAKGGGELSLSGATKTGLALGTPYYMSPEQVVGAKTIDLRTDLWSLAIVVFQCILGRRPFDSDNFGQLAVLIHTAPMPTPSSLDPSLPRAFDDWFAVAAARDPLQRFANARAFADALTAVAREGTWAPSQTGLRGAPLPGESSAGYPSASSSSSHSSTNVGLGLGSGAQRAPPTSRSATLWVGGIGVLLVLGSAGIWFATRSSGASSRSLVSPSAASSTAIVPSLPPTASAPVETLRPQPSLEVALPPAASTSIPTPAAADVDAAVPVVLGAPRAVVPPRPTQPLAPTPPRKTYVTPTATTRTKHEKDIF